MEKVSNDPNSRMLIKLVGSVGGTVAFFSGVFGSYIEHILRMLQQNPGEERSEGAIAAQWQFTMQTYGLARPSRDGVIRIDPAMPAILSIPVRTSEPPDQVLDLVEQGWQDFYGAGIVAPWQLCPIDTTRAQSSNRAF